MIIDTFANINEAFIRDVINSNGPLEVPDGLQTPKMQLHYETTNDNGDRVTYGAGSISGGGNDMGMTWITVNNTLNLPNGEIQFGYMGSRLYENDSGEVVVEDANGNTTTLS